MSVFVLEDELEDVHSFPQYGAFQVRGTHDGVCGGGVGVDRPSANRLDIASYGDNVPNSGKPQIIQWCAFYSVSVFTVI